MQADRSVAADKRGHCIRLIAFSLIGLGQAWGAQVNLVPIKDNTIYSENTANSNGAGFLFAGENGGAGTRRALIKFDIGSAIPAGSQIESVSLRLKVSKASFGDALPATLHRVLSDWGEGASNAGQRAGAGAPAQPGDATWVSRFYPGLLWSTPGGDMISTPSVIGTLGGVGTYTLGPSPAMIADVQQWLDSPVSNFGWILRGDESQPGTARQLQSRESAVPGEMPTLVVQYSTGNNAEVPLPFWSVGLLATLLMGIHRWIGRR